MSELDRGLGDAWRAASREEPPASVDDAIRAAARREVGAGPRRSRLSSWLPLAAAATVAALAIGIVEMIPREEEASPALPSPAITTPAPIGAPSNALAKGAPPDAAAMKQDAGAARAAPSLQPPDSTRAAKPVDQRARRDTAAGQSPPASPPATPPEPSAVAPGAASSPEAFPAAPPTDPAQPLADSPRASPPAAAAATQQKGLDRLEAAQEKTKRESASSERLAEQSAPNAIRQPITPAPMRSPPAQAAAQSPSETQSSRQKVGPATSAAAPAPMTPPAAPPSATGAFRSNASQSARNTEATASGGVAGTDAATAKDAASRAQNAPIRPADEWIRLIQRLRYEGRIAEAAKELAAFHEAYKDRADALLPPDLRESKR